MTPVAKPSYAKGFTVWHRRCTTYGLPYHQRPFRYCCLDPCDGNGEAWSKIEGLVDTDVLPLVTHLRLRPIKSSSPLKQPMNNTPNQRPDAVAHSVKESTSKRLAIGIATRGRPSILMETLVHLQLQSRRPDSIVVALSLIHIWHAWGRNRLRELQSRCALEPTSYHNLREQLLQPVDNAG